MIETTKDKLVGDDSKHPLAIGQKSLWLLHQLDPLSDRYNMPLTFNIGSGMTKANLQAYLECFVRNHSIMRSTFHEFEGEPYRKINKISSIAIKETTIEYHTEQELASIIRKDSSQPFDLNKGPLFRVVLYSTSSSENILLLAIHHLLFDGASLNVLVKELRTIHKTHTNASNPIELGRSEANSSFGDFVHWQKKWLQSDEADEARCYWRKALSGTLPKLPLPTTKLRSTEAIRGEVSQVQVDPKLRELIAELAIANQCSEYFIWLLLYFSFLSQYFSEDDLVVGTPAKGRADARFDDTVGYFVNMIPIRAKVKRGDSFTEFLSLHKSALYEALFNADLPLAEIVKEVDVDGVRGEDSLFQTSFIWTVVNEETENASSDLDISIYPLLHQSGEQPIALELLVEPDRMALLFKYRTHCFSSSIIDRIQQSFIYFAQQVANNPDGVLAEVALVSELERQDLYSRVNKIQATSSVNKGLHEFFEEQAAKSPDATAIVFEDDTMSYQELNLEADKLSSYLVQHGLSKHSLIGVLFDRTPRAVVAILAILKAGSAYLPLDPTYPIQRLNYIIEDSATPLVLSSSRLATTTQQLAAEVLVLDEISMVSELQSQEPLESKNSRSSTLDLAYVIYTSGSTGQPKGVMIGHSSAAEMIQWARNYYSSEELSSVLLSTSFNFDLSIFELFVPLSVGGQCVMVESILSLLQYRERYEELSLINTVPSGMQALVDAEAIPESVITINLAGEPLKKSLVESIYQITGGIRVVNLYGPSEDTTYSTALSIEQLPELEPSIGKVIDNSYLLVLNDRQQLLPNGAIGELYIGGLGLAQGYLGKDELTRQRFIQDPIFGEGRRIYRTGDRVRYREDGNLEFLGRIDHQIKLRGFRIELGEIEHCLLALEEVLDAAVIVKHAAGKEDFLVGFICVTNDEKNQDSESVRMKLTHRLPAFMIPTQLIILDQLPLNANGKLDRKSLETLSIEVGSTDYVGPIGDFETKIAKIWAELLDMPLDKISRTADFFTLGGHSLLVTKLNNRIRKNFDIVLDAKTFFDHPRLEQLSLYLKMVDEKSFADESLLEHQGLKQVDEMTIEEMEW